MKCETCGSRLVSKSNPITIIGSVLLFITGVIGGFLYNGLAGFIVAKIAFIIFVISFGNHPACPWCPAPEYEDEDDKYGV